MGRATPVELTNMCMLQRADGCVLVQDRLDPRWGGLTFPGGHVEPGESLVESVVREMREETGLTIRHPRLVGTKGWMQDDGSRYIVLLYVVREYEGELCGSPEGPVHWMSLEEMRAGRMVSEMDELLRVFLEEDVSEFWFDRTDHGWTPVIQ